MSQFVAEVVPITLTAHPSADNLSIVFVRGIVPVVVRTEDFLSADRAVYLPPDSLANGPRFDWLGSHRRIRARRFRGVYSDGMLVPPAPGDDWPLGSDQGPALGIEKYDPDEMSPAAFASQKGLQTDALPAIPGVIGYTDIEPYYKWRDVIPAGTPVIITEKIHGTNFRCVHFGADEFVVGSRRQLKRRDPDSWYWQVASTYGLERICLHEPNMIFFGEAYGRIQKLHYGTNVGLALFDLYDLIAGRWLSHAEANATFKQYDLPTAPVLYAGQWQESLLDLASGPTTLAGGHAREGIVLRPAAPAFDPSLGRVILKHISPEFKLLK